MTETLRNTGPIATAMSLCSQESTTEFIHAPRLFMPDSCIESCANAKRAAADALLANAIDETSQHDVICSGRHGLLRTCGAGVVNVGKYNDHFGKRIPGEEELFLVDPFKKIAYIGASPDTRDRISDAFEHGATEHSIHEL